MANEVIRLANVEREKRGLPPLIGNDEEYNRRCEQRALELTELYDLNRPNGEEIFELFCWINKSAGCVQKIYKGEISPEDLMFGAGGWMPANGRPIGILDPIFTHIGVACVQSGGDLYWYMIIAKI